MRVDVCVREREINAVELITPATPCSLFDQGSMSLTCEATGKPVSRSIVRMFFEI